jgi:hypothetical protein
MSPASVVRRAPVTGIGARPSRSRRSSCRGGSPSPHRRAGRCRVDWPAATRHYAAARPSPTILDICKCVGGSGASASSTPSRPLEVLATMPWYTARAVELVEARLLERMPRRRDGRGRPPPASTPGRLACADLSHPTARRTSPRLRPPSGPGRATPGSQPRADGVNYQRRYGRRPGAACCPPWSGIGLAVVDVAHRPARRAHRSRWCATRYRPRPRGRHAWYQRAIIGPRHHVVVVRLPLVHRVEAHPLAVVEGRRLPPGLVWRPDGSAYSAT